MKTRRDNVAPIMNLACAAPGPCRWGALGPATCCCAIRRVPAGVSLPSSALPPSADDGAPLLAQELWDLLQERWQASYDLQLVQRRGRMYLQVMWAYLEQQSFPLSEEGYRQKLEELVGLLNGLGVAAQVRSWLRTTSDKPRLGKAMGLALEIPAGRASEFLL